MALSRLSSAPENASGYALPITQLTKSPPGPEAKVDILLFISLSSLAANFVQASALPPPGTRNSHCIAGSKFSLAQRRPRHPSRTTQWQWHLRSNGRRTADRSSRPRAGPLSRRGAQLTRTFTVDETGKLLATLAETHQGGIVARLAFASLNHIKPQQCQPCDGKAAHAHMPLPVRLFH
jgi:hypothetical protein